MSKTPHTILGCGVAIVRDEKILLAERIAEGKPGYGLYAMPGGTVEEGEYPKDAVIREVREETGLEVINVEPLPFWHWTDKWADKPWLTLYFRATTVGQPQTMEPEKQGPWGWYGRDEIPYNTWHGAEEALLRT